MILTENIENLTKGSHKEIEVSCDFCDKKRTMEYRTYFKITNQLNDKYYCHKCSRIKVEKTNLEKYGVIAPLQNISILEKMIKTNIKRYGVEHASQLDSVKEKQKTTNLKKYGYITVLQNMELRKNGNMEKYGVEYPIQNNKIKSQIEKTNLEKYGVKNTFQYKEFRDISYLKLRKKMLLDNNIISVHDNDYLINCDICNNNILINKHIFYARKKYNTIICTTCNPISSQISGIEIQLQNFIKNNYTDEILLNNKNYILPYELDIYLPELKLAFEFNGIFWHSDIYKENNYHLNKTELCEEQGIQLIHIWEDDWLYKQDIVKSMILNKLNKTPNKIFARKTEVKEIFNNKLVREFLDKNHIQGFVGSKIKLGLFFDNELVSLMTFGNRRIAMGKKSTNEGEYELLRFCNKLNTNVVGGASKLFKYFVRNYNPKEITTYADRCISQGKLYETLGFEFIGKTQPNYYYIIDGIRHHRFNFRKDKLITEGYDSTKTEKQIMIDRKIYRIYDSGNLKFKY